MNTIEKKIASAFLSRIKYDADKGLSTNSVSQYLEFLRCVELRRAIEGPKMCYMTATEVLAASKKKKK